MRTEDTEMASGESPLVNDSKTVDDLKVQINTLIWMHAPETISLGQAEKLSIHIMNAIFAGKA